MSHLPNDEFLSKLKHLLQKQSAVRRGSIFLTQKRLAPPESTSTTTASLASSETTPLPRVPILVRATDGRNTDERCKVSTVVAPDDLEGFFTKYAEICKEGMVAMKKRDRSGKKKAKGKGKK